MYVLFKHKASIIEETIVVHRVDYQGLLTETLRRR